MMCDHDDPAASAARPHGRDVRGAGRGTITTTRRADAAGKARWSRGPGPRALGGEA